MKTIRNIRIATLAIVALSPFLVVSFADQVLAAKPGFGMLYHDGAVVRTLVPPSAFPNEGRDALYEVTNGASDQLGIASVAPGERGYHGGAWAVYVVTFNSGVGPYLLKSQQDVVDAQGAGDVTVIRAAGMDFRCPLQP